MSEISRGIQARPSARPPFFETNRAVFFTAFELSFFCLAFESHT